MAYPEKREHSDKPVMNIQQLEGRKYFQEQKAYPGLFVLILSLMDVNNLNFDLMLEIY